MPPAEADEWFLSGLGVRLDGLSRTPLTTVDQWLFGGLGVCPDQRPQTPVVARRFSPRHHEPDGRGASLLGRLVRAERIGC